MLPTATHVRPGVLRASWWVWVWVSRLAGWVAEGVAAVIAQISHQQATCEASCRERVSEFRSPVCADTPHFAFRVTLVRECVQLLYVCVWGEVVVGGCQCVCARAGASVCKRNDGAGDECTCVPVCLFACMFFQKQKETLG